MGLRLDQAITLCSYPSGPELGRQFTKFLFDHSQALLVAAGLFGAVLFGVYACRRIRNAQRYRRALYAYNLKETCTNDQVIFMYRKLMLSDQPDKTHDDPQAADSLALAMSNFETIRSYRKAQHTWYTYTDNMADVD
eukprot:TRINITY_DN6558_c0_g1_i1.p1 TRINITY_DN6558_c0_g1~~TRINITY_DN6558_c0_g1_i1.p1  ORF type:complete len:137 (-),score=9.79 TRINITY_DN6558_c0_g1_i1:39-449(-)